MEDYNVVFLFFSTVNAIIVTGSTSGKHWFSTADHPSRVTNLDLSIFCLPLPYPRVRTPHRQKEKVNAR